MRAIILAGLYLCVVPLAAAQDIMPAALAGAQSVDSQDIQSTALTIYPDNLGFVRETRSIDMPAGVIDLRFFGVSDMIIPESAVLEGFEGLRLEGNFDSDLITPAKLLERSVGETVTIRRINPGTGASDLVSAKLVSAAPNGRGITSAIFSTADGVEAYQCSGLAEAIILSNLPNGLYSVPVLSTRVVSEAAGPKEITLTYMTRGLGWAADYRMDVETGKNEAGLLGWLTLTNETSKSFKDTDLAVVAGTINQVRERSQYGNGRSSYRVANCVQGRYVTETVVVQNASSPGFFAGGGAEDEVIVTGARRAEVREAKQEDLGDYKLYRAPQAVSVEPYQTKQIAFLSKYNVGLKKGNKYRWTVSEILRNDDGDSPIKGRLIYELDNSKTGNLAVPLPAGTVRAMSQTDDGLNIFIGEDTISNKPVGLPIDLEIADSFLVTAQFFDVDEDDDGIEVRVDVKNATDKKIIAEIDFDILNNVKIQRGMRSKSLSQGNKIYTLTVPAEKTVSFSFKSNGIYD